MTAEAKTQLEAGPATAKRPRPARQENVVETLHGVEITDPYRWLEDQDSPETRDWIGEQDAYTRTLLAQTPGRAEIEQRLNRTGAYRLWSVFRPRGITPTFSRAVTPIRNCPCYIAASD